MPVHSKPPDKQLLFEKLVSELSAKFINAPVTQVDEKIESGLQDIVEFLGFERGSLFEFVEKQKKFIVTHSWAVSGVDRFPCGTLKLPWCVGKLLSGEKVVFSDPEQLPAEAEIDKQNLSSQGMKAGLCIPLTVGGSTVAAITLGSLHSEQLWPDEIVGRLRFVGEIFINAIVRSEAELKIQNTVSELEELKKQLEDDYSYLQDEIKLAHNFEEIVGQSEALLSVLFKVEQVGPTDATVIIQGETGTGKELVARAIHNASRRKDRPLIVVNCATLPESLIESELFGHEKGAFTSAQTRQVGRFELANNATIFLDEIGELPLELQPKLLRVLQEGAFERLGSSKTIKTDFRLIVATNRDLEEEVRKNRFRQDLWYRLNIFPITVPPLRQRTEDIPLLVKLFVNKFSRSFGKKITTVPAKTMKILSSYPWPGNIRELGNVIERAVITSLDEKLRVEIPNLQSVVMNDNKTLEEVEREHIVLILEKSRWKVEGRNGAAERLGLKASTLRDRMNKLDVKRPTG